MLYVFCLRVSFITKMIVFLVLIVLVIGFIIYFVKWQQNYWNRKGILFVKPKFFFGNVIDRVRGKSAACDLALEWYKKLKSSKVAYGGVYALLSPIFIPIDINLIKAMMTKDFPYFMNHGFFHSPKDILTMHLFHMEGEEWKNLRTKLTPTFTSSKMKMMFDTLLEKANILDKVFATFTDSQEPINIKDILGRFTTDIIGSCAFGIECNSMENADNEFRTFGKKVLDRSVWRPLISNTIPKSFLIAINFKLHNPSLINFFSDVVKQTIKQREDNNIFRKDFMQLMIELKNQDFLSCKDENIASSKTEKRRKLTLIEIIPQVYAFFVAGFETSSTAMTFCLFELAKNSIIQERLREEIQEMLKKSDGKILYNDVMTIPYLNQVLNETLRMYPPVPVIPRICSKTYKVFETNLTIEKGTRVHIPVFGIHRDSEYYPNPDVFDPEHFSQENIAKRPDFSFLPFGEGPRMCIGMRFGMMQTKLGLVSLLSKYRFSVNKNTIIPITFEPKSLGLSVHGDVWLDAVKI